MDLVITPTGRRLFMAELGTGSPRQHHQDHRSNPTLVRHPVLAATALFDNTAACVCFSICLKQTVNQAEEHGNLITQIRADLDVCSEVSRHSSVSGSGSKVDITPFM